MQHQVEQQLPQVALYEYCNNLGPNCGVNPRDDCGRGTTLYSNHRVEYDGQNQILPTEHAVFILSTLLSISLNSNQNSIASPKAQSYVQW